MLAYPMSHLYVILHFLIFIGIGILIYLLWSKFFGKIVFAFLSLPLPDAMSRHIMYLQMLASIVCKKYPRLNVVINISKSEEV